MDDSENLSSQALCERLAAHMDDASAWETLENRLMLARHRPEAIDDGLWVHAQALFKNVVWRDIRTFWRAGTQTVPYLMYGPVANHREEAVSFDTLGMRTSLKAGRPVSYEEFLATPLRRGVVIGNSTAAGVGVSKDAATLTSILNTLTPDTLWFNMAVGGHNLFQNALALCLFAPDKLDYAVVCGGLIDFLSPITMQTRTPRLPSYIPPHQPPDTPTSYDIGENGWSEPLVLRSCRRALEMILDQAARRGARPLFLLQPHLALTDKDLSPEERSMMMIYENSADRPIWKAHLVLARYRQRILESLSGICASLGMDFADAGSDSLFMGKDWLYLDYIHVNDDGHARLAALIHRWARKRD